MKKALFLYFLLIGNMSLAQSVQPSGAQNIWQRNDGGASVSTVLRPPTHDTVHPSNYTNLTKTGSFLFRPQDGLFYGNDGVRYQEFLYARKAAIIYATKFELGNYLPTTIANATFQPVGDYLTLPAAIEVFQPIGSYITPTQAALLYQPIGNYLNSEFDPVFTAHAAFGVTIGGITNWNTAFSWGNHAIAGYLLSSIAAATYQPLLGFNPYNSANPAGYINLIQARTSIIFTTNGTGAATYNAATGAMNVPTPPTIRRQEPYSGSTNASGVYTVTFSTAYSVAPNIQVSISNQTLTNQFIRVSSVTTTGCTVNVFQRNSVTLLGIDVLLSATSNVSGAAVDILVTEK